METDQSRVIAIEGECDCHTVHLAKVHHRDFPHIHAEAVTPTIAAAYLAEQLTRVLDTAPDPVNREQIQKAIDDVRYLIQSYDFLEIARRDDHGECRPETDHRDRESLPRLQ